MKATLTALALMFAASGLAQGWTRNVYLPLYNSQETKQTCTITLSKVGSPKVFIKHPCFVTINDAVITVTNGNAQVTMSIDLGRATEPFTITLLGMDQDGKFTEQDGHVSCHLSLVPEKVQVTYTTNGFHVANLTSKPLQVEASTGVVFSEQTPQALSGQFSPGATIKLQGSREIRLK